MIVHLGKSQDYCMSLFVFEGINLEMVQAYKYLGVWLSTNRIYNKAQQAQANQGKKAIFALQRLLACKVKPPTHHHATVSGMKSISDMSVLYIMT